MPRSKKYHVNLSDEEKVKLRQAIASPATPPIVKVRANVLLAVDTSEGRISGTIADIAKKYGQHHSFVCKLKRKYLEKGLDKAVFERPLGEIIWLIDLSKSERQRLKQLLDSKDTPDHIKLKAHVLLIYDKVDHRLPPNTIRDKTGFHIPRHTIVRTRQMYLKKGLDAIISSSRSPRTHSISPVILTKAQKLKLKQALNSKDMPAIVRKRARLLLDIDESDGQTPSKLADVAEQNGLSHSTTLNIKKKFLTKGLDVAVFAHPYYPDKWSVMPKSREYLIKLSKEERAKLLQVVNSPATPSMVKIRAQIFLDIDTSEERSSDTIISVSKKYGLHRSFVCRLKRKYREKGVDHAVFKCPYGGVSWLIDLSKNEKLRLEQLLDSEDTPDHIKLKARILLAYDKVDYRLSPDAMRDKIGHHIPSATISYIKETYVKKGLDVLLSSSRALRTHSKSAVRLTKIQKLKLKQALCSKDTPAIVKKRASILLDIDESDGQTPSKPADAAKKCNLSSHTALNIKKKFLTKGLNAAVFKYPYCPGKRFIDLSKSDRQKLEQLLNQKDAHPNAKLKARILLAYDKVDSRSSSQAAYNKIGRDICPSKIVHIKELYIKNGVDAIISPSIYDRKSKYRVLLSESQRQELKRILRSSDTTPITKRCASILLDVDLSNGQTIRIVDLTQKYNISPVTIVKLKKKYLQKGLDAVY